MILEVLWRSILVGTAYVLAVTIGAMVTQALGIPPPQLDMSTTPLRSMLGVFGAGLLYGIVLGPLVLRLRIDWLGRTLIAFALVYVIATVSSLIEALFFTTLPHAAMAFMLVHNAIAALLMALALAGLFRPRRPIRPLDAAVTESLARHHIATWIVRFVLAGLAYVPIYFLFGMMAYAIVGPYYTQPGAVAGMELRVPSLDVILPLESLRGLLMVATVFPIVLLWTNGRASLALWLGLALAVTGAWAPMLQADFLPLTMRIVHGLEITADAFAHAAVIAWVLGVARPAVPLSQPTERVEALA